MIEPNAWWSERVTVADHGCWEWTGYRDKFGYGKLWHDGKQYLAHRLSLTQSGVDLSGKMACHHCDNPPCVRPDHLYAGDQASNMRDAAERRRKCPNGHEYPPTARPATLGAHRCPTCLAQRRRPKFDRAGYLSITDICRIHRVGPGTVGKWKRGGMVPDIMDVRSPLWRSATVRRYLAARPPQGAKPRPCARCGVRAQVERLTWMCRACVGAERES